MKTNAPRFITWLIAFLLGLGGILGHYGIVTGFLAANAFMLLMIGFAILVLGTLFKGL